LQPEGSALTGTRRADSIEAPRHFDV